MLVARSPRFPAGASSSSLRPISTVVAIRRGFGLAKMQRARFRYRSAENVSSERTGIYGHCQICNGLAEMREGLVWVPRKNRANLSLCPRSVQCGKSVCHFCVEVLRLAKMASLQCVDAGWEFDVLMIRRRG